MISELVYENRPGLRLPRPAFFARKMKAGHHNQPLDEVRELEPVLEAFGLENCGPIHVLHGALRNETWQVQAEGGRKVLKRYKPELDYDQIQHEHSILLHLQGERFPAPRLLHSLAGQTIYPFAGRYYSVFDFLEGYFKYGSYFFLPSQYSYYLFSIGKTLGMLHHALDGFVPEGVNENGFRSLAGDRIYNTSWYLDKLSILIDQSHDDDVCEVFRQLTGKCNWLRDRLGALGDILDAAPLERGIIHGDYGPYNLLIRPGKPIVVLDFEMARLDWRIFDLIFAISSATGKNQRYDMKKAAAIARGYKSVRTLPEWDASQIGLVWEYSLLRRMVILWERYLKSRSIRISREIKVKLAAVDWLHENQQRLVETVCDA